MAGRQALNRVMKVQPLLPEIHRSSMVERPAVNRRPLKVRVLPVECWLSRRLGMAAVCKTVKLGSNPRRALIAPFV